MNQADFVAGNTYKTVGGGLYRYQGKSDSGHDIFIRVKDDFFVEAFDARYNDNGLVAWGSASGHPARADD